MLSQVDTYSKKDCPPPSKDLVSYKLITEWVNDILLLIVLVCVAHANL